MKDKHRLILLAVSYLIVLAFGVWMLTLPLLLQVMVGTVRGTAVLMTVGFVLIAGAALGLVNVVRKF